MTLYLRQYFALEVDINAFWRVVGHQFKCTYYDHPVNDGANFCEMCGAPVARIPLTEPTDSFREFCDQHGTTPEETFHLLTEEMWEWSDDEEGREVIRLGLHAVQAVSKPDQKDEHQKWGLGVKFDFVKVGDPTRSQDFTCGVPYSTLRAAEKAIREAAELFGLIGEPTFYSQVEFRS